MSEEKFYKGREVWFTKYAATRGIAKMFVSDEPPANGNYFHIGRTPNSRSIFVQRCVDVYVTQEEAEAAARKKIEAKIKAHQREIAKLNNMLIEGLKYEENV